MCVSSFSCMEMASFLIKLHCKLHIFFHFLSFLFCFICSPFTFVLCLFSIFIEKNHCNTLKLKKLELIFTWKFSSLSFLPIPIMFLRADFLQSFSSFYTLLCPHTLRYLWRLLNLGITDNFLNIITGLVLPIITLSWVLFPLEKVDEVRAEVPGELVCLDVLLALGDKRADGQVLSHLSRCSGGPED